MAPKIYKYPDLPPVGSSADAGLEGLGINWNSGGEGLTQWVDYIQFSAYTPKYDGSAILQSFATEAQQKSISSVKEATKSSGESVYLYMPANVSVNYTASYNNTKFGVGGMAAAQMLGSTGSAEEVAGTLKNAAAGAVPEAGFKAVSEAANSISQFIGVDGSVSGNDLAAVSQGRIFNPYEEQIFNGITFRAHQFQFKLIARDKKEAEDIENIIKFFKKTMLPSYNQEIGNATQGPVQKNDPKASPPGGGTVADKLTPPFSNIKNRYLNVPARLMVQFVRIKRNGADLKYTSSSAEALKLYQFKDCIIDSFQVNYTPDGGYVNTNDGYVPALDISVGLKEISLVTQEDIPNGF